MSTQAINRRCLWEGELVLGKGEGEKNARVGRQVVTLARKSLNQVPRVVGACVCWSVDYFCPIHFITQACIVLVKNGNKVQSKTLSQAHFLNEMKITEDLTI